MKKYYDEKIETASVDQIKQIQSERLVATVKRVYENVPLYAAKMKEAGVSPTDIRGVDDLSKLPFSCKQDLRDSYPFGLFAVPMKDVVRLHASSGTTGKQIVVGYTQKDLDTWAGLIARAFTAAGADASDIIQVAFGYGLFTGGLGVDGGAKYLGAATVPTSTGNTSRQLNLMKDFGTTLLCSTPSYAMHLGESIKKEGFDLKDFKLKAGIFGAEPWTNEMRHQIEAMLGIKAYDIYGLTELMGPGVAFECEEQTGMHINEDCFIVETIDPDTCEVLPEGTQGELVFTAIAKEAFPIIRYRTRDIGTVKRTKCSCGRTLIKMTKPKGRTDDMLIIRGVNVFPSQVETVLSNQGYPANYQIVVDRHDNSDSMEVRVEVTDAMFTDTIKGMASAERRLEAELKSLLGIVADVKLVEPGSIERFEGKAKRVIDRRNLID